MRVLVCGGREFKNTAFVFKCLDRLHAAKEGPIGVVIHGDARGADRLGARWAAKHDVPATAYPANWTLHGKAAGPKRNQRMLDDGKPEVVVAFPGGVGTADMVRRAKAAGLIVLEPKP